MRIKIKKSTHIHHTHINKFRFFFLLYILKETCDFILNIILDTNLHVYFFYLFLRPNYKIYTFYK
jgi:hypothetical protein